jgi:hypothetical protein
MRRFIVAICVAAVACATGVAMASAAKVQTLCVQGGNPHCYSTIQSALSVAHDGDTIRVSAGTFAGGISITKSINLSGAGSAETIIRGGGPVLTIGADGAATEPTVSISGVTITGGETHGDGTVAPGGGIDIPAAANRSPGATVTLSNAVVTGNRAEPTVSAAIGPPCPTGPCPYASGQGGGIYNGGSLTINSSAITDNLAAGVSSDADGGGIWSGFGSLSVANSLVARNRALAVIPNGRFAEGGGMFVDSGSLSVRNTIVSGNSAQLTSALPSMAGGNVIDMNANSGGIHVGDGVPTTVANTTISANFVSATDLLGEPLGFDSAILVGDSPLTMRNTQITGNQSTQTTATTADVGPGGSALELDGGGTIIDTRITGNDSSAISPNGDAAVNGALAILNFNNDPRLVMMQDSVVSGNTATATSTSGSATVQGAGIFSNSLLDLRGDRVSDNSGTATGPAGAAEGGGIWNGIELSGPPVTLTLENTSVTHNSLTGTAGIASRGGGLFTNQPVTLTNSLIAHNAPDQCVGC